jgi:hypothetical protein
MDFGLIVAFDLFVGSMRRSSITDNEGSLEEKRSTLGALNNNEFDAQYFECLLDKLINVNFEYNKYLEDKSTY